MNIKTNLLLKIHIRIHKITNQILLVNDNKLTFNFLFVFLIVPLMFCFVLIITIITGILKFPSLTETAQINKLKKIKEKSVILNNEK